MDLTENKSCPDVDQQITWFLTRDLEATVRFYENAVGLTCVLDQKDVNCRIYRVSSDGYIGFCQRDYVPEQPAKICITIVSTKVDEWYQHLCDHGVTVDKPPAFSSKANLYHFFCRDPNGYTLEVQQFLDPSWNCC